MIRENSTQYALLGLLTVQPMSGYEIKKNIENSISFFWSESFGQIYPALKKMERNNLIKSKNMPDQKGKLKTVYQITNNGRKKLAEWLHKPVQPSRKRNELLLKLFFGNQMSSETLESHFNKEKEKHQSLMQMYQITEKKLDTECSLLPDYEFWKITLFYGQFQSQAILEWVEKSRDLLSKKKKSI